MSGARLGWALLLGSLSVQMAQAAEESEASIRVLLTPALETTLASQVAGRVDAVQASLGSTFAKGDKLVQLDCAEQRARLQMAEADQLAARESHQAKQRLQALQQAGEVEVALAASAASRARAQVALYQAQVAQCTVKAPFAGRVVKVAVKPFQGVNAGQPLLEIVSNQAPKLRLNVPGKWVTWLKVGTPFAVQIDETGQSYPAQVSAINGRIDAVSQSIELEATLNDAKASLLPGMSGTAQFSPAQP